jgi:hypothetical protein
MTSFTVTKKGEDISFDSTFANLSDAKEYLQECMSYNNFAMNLVSANKLSEKQIAWIHYLATQSKIDAETPVPVGEYSDLVTKMYTAGAKRSKFQVRLPGVKISTVNRGSNIGCLYVYENNEYVGKITQSGVLIGDNISEDVKNILDDANENLLRLAKIYGHETGNCSICGITLSDPLSIQMGMGPQCRKRFDA